MNQDPMNQSGENVLAPAFNADDAPEMVLRPATLDEFYRTFPTERRCSEVLRRLRWPDGSPR